METLYGLNMKGPQEYTRPENIAALFGKLNAACMTCLFETHTATVVAADQPTSVVNIFNSESRATIESVGEVSGNNSKCPSQQVL